MRSNSMLHLFVLLFATIFSLPCSIRATAEESQSLPNHFDLSPKYQELGLHPRAQGSRPTCSLFAITALAEFENAKENPKSAGRFSEEYLIWAANEATGRSGDQAMFYEAVEGLNVLGICSREAMPYEKKSDDARKPSTQILENAKANVGRWQVNWIKRWDIRNPLSDDQLHAMKKAISSGNPVACGLRWPKSLKGHEILDVPPADQVHDGHSIAFVGYEDDSAKPGGGIFIFRNSFGSRWGNSGYGVMSYAYARAYANDALWLSLGPKNSETPIERFELEQLTLVHKSEGRTSTWPMLRWGNYWSGGEQFFCKFAEGGYVEFQLPVKQEGSYRVRLLGTSAPFHGKIGFMLDGKEVGSEFDLYSGRVSSSGSLELGTHKLTKGDHTLRVTCTGKNPASTGLAFGLDVVDLLEDAGTASK